MPRPRLKDFRHSRKIIAYAVWGYCGSGWPRVGAIGVLWVWGALGSLPRHVGHRGVRRAPGLRSFRETSALQTYIPSTGDPRERISPTGVLTGGNQSLEGSGTYVPYLFQPVSKVSGT
jgi:hypothetical protein